MICLVIALSFFYFFVCILLPVQPLVLLCHIAIVSLKSLLDCEYVRVCMHMAEDFNGTLCGTGLSANLRQKEEENFVIGKGRM